MKNNEKDKVVSSEWETRHKETQRIKDGIRERINNATSNSVSARQYFIPAKPTPTIDDGEHKKVAAYTRVSTAAIEQVSSIENQTAYYERKINDTPNWELQKIYSDEGKSGTSMRHRTAFKQMLKDAKNKEMDLIICASVSRFARNISDCLDQVSELKTANPSHPVGVYFETENIYTLNPDSEQALSFHALLADWESANKSRRMILSYDQRILTGQYPVADLLGYRHTKSGELIIKPDEARTVRLIFLSHLAGQSYSEIAEKLTEMKRPTLRGRTEWNRSMVANIMTNERRWGELESRKHIVVDYKKGKIKKNDHDRCSAYVPEHHEAIVSPAIAKAVKFIKNTPRRYKNGVADIKVITDGALIGFINIHPSWSGMNSEMLSSISLSAYQSVNAEDLTRYLYDDTQKTIDFSFHDYQVPYGIGYLTPRMPSLTIKSNSISFNSRCKKKLNMCPKIDMLYNPVLKAIIIRESVDESNSLEWIAEDGNEISTFPTQSLSKAIYENMSWRNDYNYRFRGITKEKSGIRFMFFFLDEPQLILSSKQKQELLEKGVDLSKDISYIPHTNGDNDVSVSALKGYPSEWNTQIGISNKTRMVRKSIFNSINFEDIVSNGITVVNPLIGNIPTKEEINSEIEELLRSM